MEPVTRVETLNEDVCVLRCVYAIRKGMNSSVLSSAVGK